ncbi:MAG: peptidylprolyl isomerase [Planctomycetes bacterium]|nr:peptidylprolyl isomerase [Planctomycetota bacterium]
MKHLIAPAAALLVLVACGKNDPVPPPPTGGGSSGARPEKLPNGEPSVITVKHVLIAFEGAERSDQKRSKAEAQKLAYELLNRAKSGEDFDKLMKESNDPGEGTYTLVNHGLKADESGKEYDRSGMVPAFGDVGFRILVGEVGLAEHDPKTSPFGYHVIKRVK